MNAQQHGRPSTAPRILVVANETVGSTRLREAIVDAAGEAGRVMVVAPALNSRLRHWMSDEAGARAAAERRLVACLADLREAGVAAEGCVGDADPLLAIRDLLRLFPADEIIVATHAEGRSNWLARGLPERARTAFALPVLHVVAESGAPGLVAVAA